VNFRFFFYIDNRKHRSIFKKNEVELSHSSLLSSHNITNASKEHIVNNNNNNNNLNNNNKSENNNNEDNDNDKKKKKEKEKIKLKDRRESLRSSRSSVNRLSISKLFKKFRNRMESTTNVPSKTNSACSTTNCANVVTIPVPIVHNEGTFYYITVKGSLHDRSCSVFGLNDAEIQAISKRFENSVKPVMNGVMISVPPMDMVNTLSQLSYKVVCSSGEAEICWTMQREV